ncbi:MAG: hypothetical protein H6728_12865 [Myxococcales bacterium]|nr:hypothetical protein [Myxococcales bacterium]MCB9643960.1 hypothetical protein [Myxococcales bacterium]
MPTTRLFCVLLFFSVPLFLVGACLPSVPPTQTGLFCASNTDCPSDTRCIRSVCQPDSAYKPYCSDDIDEGIPCIPAPEDPIQLTDGPRRMGEDDDLDASPSAEPPPEVESADSYSLGREQGAEPNFDVAPREPAVVSQMDERRHVERLVEPSSEPVVLPDSSKDPNEVCSNGATQPCYPPRVAGCTLHSGRCFGRCKLGKQTCKQGQWSTCEGAITPEKEKCDEFDWDCDGSVGTDGRFCNTP